MSREAIPQEVPLPDAAEELRLRRQVEEESQREARASQVRVLVGRILLIAGILVCWQLASGPILNQRYISQPTEIVAILGRWFGRGEIYDHLKTTLIEVLAGYLIGLTLALITATILGFFERPSQILSPFIMAFYGIPKLALAPLIVMWFGLGITPKIVISTIMVFFVIFVNSLVGLQNVSPGLINTSRVMGASRLQLLQKIMLPSAAPYILTAMRITIPDAVVGAIMGELIAGTLGMGNLIRRSSNQMITAGVFAGIFVLAVLVILMRSAISPLEHRFMGWHEQADS